MSAYVNSTLSNSAIRLYDNLCPPPHITRLEKGNINVEVLSIGKKFGYLLVNIIYAVGNLILGTVAYISFILDHICSKFYTKKILVLENKPQARISRVLAWTAERLQLEWNQGWAKRKEGEAQGTCLGTMDVTLGSEHQVLHADFTPASEYRRDLILNKGYIASDSGSGDIVKEGIAISLFQSSGLGTQFCPTRIKGKPLRGRCDWNLKPETHKTKRFIQGDFNNGTMEVPIEGSDGTNHTHFIDILGNPDNYIGMIKSMGCNVLRFSLERSVIQPDSPNMTEVNGEKVIKNNYEDDVLDLYRNFINKLIENGIEPDITLCHFVHPDWFTEDRGFENSDNRDNFILYAKEMIEAFPQVKNIRIFNEIGVDIVQKYIRGVYPPRLLNQVAKAATVAINMLIAHVQIYTRAFEEREKGNKLYEGRKISSTLQWLKFKPMEGNIIERTVAFVLTNVFHTFIYNFFLTGIFTFKIPFLVNRQLIIPKEDLKKYNRFLDEVAVQFYGFPKVKIGGNGGVKYPGREETGEVTNIIFLQNWLGVTFGSTCRKGEGSAAMSFGPAFEKGSYRQQYKEVLDEATELCKPVVCANKDLEIVDNRRNWREIAVTEWGRDACVQTSDRRANFRVDDYSKKVGDQLQLEGYKELEQVLRDNAKQWNSSRNRRVQEESKMFSKSLTG